MSAERARVLCGDPDDDAVRVEALTKVYVSLIFNDLML